MKEQIMDRPDPMQPIRDDVELTRANATIDELIKRNDLSPEDHVYLDRLGDRVWEYEQVHYPMAGDPGYAGPY